MHTFLHTKSARSSDDKSLTSTSSDQAAKAPIHGLTPAETEDTPRATYTTRATEGDSLQDENRDPVEEGIDDSDDWEDEDSEDAKEERKSDEDSIDPGDYDSDDYESDAEEERFHSKQRGIDKSRFECTCGHCIEGILSPRLATVLQRHADTICETVQKGLDRLNGLDTLKDPRGRGGDLEYYVGKWGWANLLTDFPVRIEYTMHYEQKLWKGFISLLRHVSRCIDDEKVPTTPNVLPLREDESPQWSKLFLDQGGTVTHVVLGLLRQHTYDMRKYYDGGRTRTVPRLPDEGPTCDNDRRHRKLRIAYWRSEGLRQDPEFDCLDYD